MGTPTRKIFCKNLVEVLAYWQSEVYFSTAQLLSWKRAAGQNHPQSQPRLSCFLKSAQSPPSENPAGFSGMNERPWHEADR
jgi:hypothetical protein